ncbi:MAG TPA: anti-sigma regulatory factor [Thermoanaerobaculia bacterium]|nr:anti-sigma regulatory factor [Thermoanaerobaculia bacterium]
MLPARHERLEVKASDEVVTVRQVVRDFAISAKLSLVDQTKLITAASELARNMVVYGGGGVAIVEQLESDGRAGVRVTFEDKGPGIPDIAQALRDGYTSGSGLGLGLGGAKRLVNEFEIRSAAGEGTTVVITRWK